jgi:hypothetical protein
MSRSNGTYTITRETMIDTGGIVNKVTSCDQTLGGFRDMHQMLQVRRSYISELSVRRRPNYRSQ